MNTLNIWLIRINMVVWGLVIMLFLKGCAASGDEVSETGSLLCFGYCDLQIANSDRRVVIKPDGTITRTKESRGIAKPVTIEVEEVVD